jgi:hypothetical protein
LPSFQREEENKEERKINKNINNNIHLLYQELQIFTGMKCYKFFKQQSRFEETLSFLTLTVHYA